MKLEFPDFQDFPDEYDADYMTRFVGRLREFGRTLEKAFAKVRTDDSIIIGGGQPIKKHFSATATWNPANVADKASTTTTVTVTGAALGDEVSCSFSLSLAGLQLTGYVSATDTVTCVLSNLTGGAVDLGSGTLRASVWRH